MEDLHGLAVNKPPGGAVPRLYTSTTAGKAMFQMLGVFSELKRGIIRERLNAGLARRALRWAVLASIPTSRNASGSSARRVTATSRFAVTSASAPAPCSALSLQADLSPPPARL